MRLFLDKYLFKTVIDIARSLIVVVIDLLIVTLCIQYFYAALGFELFGSTHVNKAWVLTSYPKLIISYRINPFKSQVILGDYHEQGDYYAYNCQTGFATLSCSALMAFQMISTNDIPEVMEGLRLDYHDGNGQWQIIVQLYFLRKVFL